MAVVFPAPFGPKKPNAEATISSDHPGERWQFLRKRQNPTYVVVGLAGNDKIERLPRRQFLFSPPVGSPPVGAENYPDYSYNTDCYAVVTMNVLEALLARSHVVFVH